MAAVSCRDPYVTVSLKRKTVVCVQYQKMVPVPAGTMHSPEALEDCRLIYRLETLVPCPGTVLVLVRVGPWRRPWI